MCTDCSSQKRTMSWADWKGIYGKTCCVTYNGAFIRVDFDRLTGKADCFHLTDFVVSSAGGLWVHLIRRER